MASATSDLYGFSLVALTPADDKARSDCIAKAARFHAKWDRLLVLTDACAWRCGAVPAKVKLMVRESGIPARLRPALWAQLAGAGELRATEEPGYYKELVRAAGVHGLPLTHLEVELSAATCATHPASHSRRTLEAVRRMVMAYGVRNEACGYNSSLNGLALFLLVLVGGDQGFDAEEGAFWLMAALLENLLPPAYFENCKGVTIEQRVFVALLAKKCPRVTAAMERLDLDPGALTAPWFDSLFTKTLPPETAARVWDWLFVEGPKVLFRVALALFKVNETTLLGTYSGAQLPRTLSWRASRMYNADALGKAAFKGIGSLSTVVIQRNRASLERLVQEEIDARRQRIEALLAPPQAPRPMRQRPASEPLLMAIAEGDEEEEGLAGGACFSSGQASSEALSYLSE